MGSAREAPQRAKSGRLKDRRFAALEQLRNSLRPEEGSIGTGSEFLCPPTKPGHSFQARHAIAKMPFLRVSDYFPFRRVTGSGMRALPFTRTGTRETPFHWRFP